MLYVLTELRGPGVQGLEGAGYYSAAHANGVNSVGGVVGAARPIDRHGDQGLVGTYWHSAHFGTACRMRTPPSCSQ